MQPKAVCDPPLKREEEEEGFRHPVALTKAIHKEIGSIKQARFLSKGRMLVEMMNAKQEKLLKMKTLNEVRIKCHVPGANRKIL